MYKRQQMHRAAELRGGKKIKLRWNTPTEVRRSLAKVNNCLLYTSSRFLVIDMPALTKENLYRIIRHDYPKIKEEALDAFGGLFLDLQEKADNSEISTKCCLLYTSVLPGKGRHAVCIRGSLWDMRRRIRSLWRTGT